MYLESDVLYPRLTCLSDLLIVGLVLSVMRTIYYCLLRSVYARYWRTECSYILSSYWWKICFFNLKKLVLISHQMCRLLCHVGRNWTAGVDVTSRCSQLRAGLQSQRGCICTFVYAEWCPTADVIGQKVGEGEEESEDRDIEHPESCRAGENRFFGFGYRPEAKESIVPVRWCWRAVRNCFRLQM